MKICKLFRENTYQKVKYIQNPQGLIIGGDESWRHRRNPPWQIRKAGTGSRLTDGLFPILSFLHYSQEIGHR
jgi:hypothetical protein